MPIYEHGTGEVDPYDMQNGSRRNMNAVYALQDGSPVKIWPSHKEIDYFEDGNLGEYSHSFSGSAVVQSGNLGPTSGSQRLKLDQQRRLISLSGDGLPNYPSWGETWEFYFRPLSFYNTPAFLRCDFMDLRSYSTNNCYRLEWESNPTSGSDWSLEKRSGGSNVIIEATEDNLGVDVGTTYRCVVDMDWSSGTIQADWYDYDASSHLRSLTLTDSNQLTGPAIGWETNGYMECAFDTGRILP